MSMNTKQFNEYIVTPALKELGLYSDSARNLILGTCAQESNMGTYIHQINGPALGIYQCEPRTHRDIWINCLKFKSDLTKKIMKISGRGEKPFGQPAFDNLLISNIKYATAICRIHYLRVKEQLPSANAIGGLAQYWKKYYNTVYGQGTVEEFMNNYYKHRVDKL